MLATTTPLWVTVLFGAAMLAAAGVLWWVAERTADGSLGRNGYAGIRTKATRASDEAWLAAHQASLPWSRASAAAAALTGVLVIPARSSAGATLAVMFGGTAIVLATTLIGARVGVAAARDVTATTDG